MNSLPNSRVYFARCIAWDGHDLGAIKIGLSYQPSDRVNSVCQNLPFECELVASIPGDHFTEIFIHMWLRKLRLGGEYFKAIGETMRIMDHVKTNEALPFTIHEKSMWSHEFSKLDAKPFMDAHGISFKEIEKLSGVAADYYSKLFEKTGKLNRRGLAALAVTAVKRGITVYWPRDFIPPHPLPVSPGGRDRPRRLTPLSAGVTS